MHQYAHISLLDVVGHGTDKALVAGIMGMRADDMLF